MHVPSAYPGFAQIVCTPCRANRTEDERARDAKSLVRGIRLFSWI